MGGYRDTLNLPETPFPMRAQLAQREPGMLTHMQQTKLYERVRAVCTGRERSYILHDGPPYANGDLHMGHVINKCLKDFVFRTKLTLGYDASYIPGWDCHGLPIEREMEKQKVSKEDPIEFRRQCRKFAETQIELQRKGFERLGVLGDWDNHYRTMRPSTEGDIVRALGALQRTGLIYRALRPVLHCTVCQSSLAEAEIEYADHVSQAVDVAFMATDAAAVATVFGVAAAHGAAAVIWTTTAWTLPANKCIVINPALHYSLLATQQGHFIVATELIEACLARWELAGKQVASVEGAKLLGLEFRHPFYDQAAPIYAAAHATAQEGTGLVHTAPAHGQDDFIVGKKHGIDSKSPVDPAGNYYDWVENFAGLEVWQAVPVIIKTLRASGNLLAHVSYEHSYPVCWRHKTPVLFRTSMQWFVDMDKKGDCDTTLRERSIAAIEKTDYFPEWGRERMKAMVATRPDWCLSRQRMWNSPVAFFVHKQTGELHPRTDELIEEVAKLVSTEGIEGWFAMPAEQLLGAEAKDYEKVNDTLDVWFDSGVTHQAVMQWHGHTEKRPDMYLEGSDQHRGWFMSSLMTSCALYGEPPWRQVLTHGFVVDGNGRKMSKSLGNALSPKKLLSEHGADVLRMWVAMTDYGQEVRLSQQIIATNIDSYRLLRNRIRFLLANIADFNVACDALPIDQLAELDRYVLVLAERRRSKIYAYFDRYAFHQGMQELHEFCNADLGRFYFDIIKDRLYTLPLTCRARRSAQTALHHITRMVLLALGPILSFTADEAWQVYTGDSDESTMLHTLDSLPQVTDAKQLDTHWACVRAWRAKVSKAVEQARVGKTIGCADVELAVTLTVTQADHVLLTHFSADDLAHALLVSSVVLAVGDEGVAIGQATHDKCPRCWRRAVGIGAGVDANVCARCEAALAGEANEERQV